jgi:hypothetical protein
VIWLASFLTWRSPPDAYEAGRLGLAKSRSLTIGAETLWVGAGALWLWAVAVWVPADAWPVEAGVAELWPLSDGTRATDGSEDFFSWEAMADLDVCAGLVVGCEPAEAGAVGALAAGTENSLMICFALTRAAFGTG